MPSAERPSADDAPRRWVAAATAPDQLTAELWIALLAEAGIPAQINPGDVAAFLGVAPRPVQILTPEPLAEEARRVLQEPQTTADPEPPNGRPVDRS